MVSAALLAWAVIYGLRAFDEHAALRTNAYDLSVFDYALWNTGRGRLGYVPFMGHSLFSHHVMPTLLLLWPAYQLFATPEFLIAVQLLAFFAAAVLLYRLLPDDLPLVATAAIMTAFLFGRRSHSAVASGFYIESLEPLLVFAMILAWRSGRQLTALAAGVLALGCKEDIAFYLAAFGALVVYRSSRRAGLMIATAAAVWLVVASVLVIPAFRVHDGLPAANPFVEASFGSSAAVQQSVERLSIARTVDVLAMLTASSGFLSLLQPSWLAVALPGLFVTLMANPTGSGISGHYLFPLLPWVFAATALGVPAFQRRRPGLLRVLSILLLIGTVADSPLWRTAGRVTSDERSAAAAVRRALSAVPPDASVLAMANLVPHLPHRDRIWSLGVSEPSEMATYVVIGEVGDLWPLGRDGVAAALREYSSSSQYKEMSGGPLHVFRRVPE